MFYEPSSPYFTERPLLEEATYLRAITANVKARKSSNLSPLGLTKDYKENS